MFLRGLLFLFLVSIFPFAYGSENVQIYSYHHKPPFIVNLDKKQGLTFDIVKLMNKHSTKHKYKVNYLPRKRLDLKENRIVLWTHPKWEMKRDNFQWFSLKLEDSDVIIFKEENKIDFKGPESLVGETLVCVTGYFYKSINELMKSGDIKRVNLTAESQIIEVIDHDRYKYGIMSLSALNYTQDRSPKFKSILYANNPQDSFERHIQISVSQPNVINGIKSLLENIKFKKDLRSLYNFYGLRK